MKTIVNNQECTVKHPTVFNAEELKRLKDEAAERWLKAPGNTTFVITEFYMIDVCRKMVDLLKQGYEHDTDGRHLSNPFIIPFKKKEEEIKLEIENIKADIEDRYKAKIKQEVALAKANLVLQRKALLERKEQEKVEKAEQRLLTELEQEASDLFDQYLIFDNK